MPIERLIRTAAMPLRYLLLIVLFALTGCGARPGAEVLKPTALSTAQPGTSVQTLYVATSRTPSKTTPGAFTSERSMETSYAEYRISVPPTHKTGAIEWPTAARDPKTSFVTVGYRKLDRAEFERAVVASAAGMKSRVGIFVHGYNNNFQESLFRLAQMSADAGAGATPVLYAWPSEASVGGYIADKDAVTFSRDGLVDLFTMFGENRKLQTIGVIGHSMGAWLTTEALRQLRLSHRDDVVRRMKVVLASPDIDVDVFRAQFGSYRPARTSMTLLVSKDDKALAVSRLLSGERERLGALDVDDPAVATAARQANVQVVDISSQKTDDSFNHNRFADMAKLYPKMAEEEESRNQALLPQAGAFVFNAAHALTFAPLRLAGRVAAGQ